MGPYGNGNASNDDVVRLDAPADEEQGEATFNESRQLEFIRYGGPWMLGDRYSLVKAHQLLLRAVAE